MNPKESKVTAEDIYTKLKMLYLKRSELNKALDMLMDEMGSNSIPYKLLKEQAEALELEIRKFSKQEYIEAEVETLF